MSPLFVFLEGEDLPFFEVLLFDGEGLPCEGEGPLPPLPVEPESDGPLGFRVDEDEGPLPLVSGFGEGPGQLQMSMQRVQSADGCWEAVHFGEQTNCPMLIPFVAKQVSGVAPVHPHGPGPSSKQ